MPPTTRMCDLPQKLIGEKIFPRVPITSLREVRSTCKSWDAITKRWILGYEATATQQFLGFMTMNSKLCSLRYEQKQKRDDSVDDVSIDIKQVDSLNQVEISKVFHCDGLLLCVAKDSSKLVVWNPYLCQTRSIGPRNKFWSYDRYALGYDTNRNHKILRFVDERGGGGAEEYEIYDLSGCDSWRVLDVVTRDWEIQQFRRGVSVKGNAYFFAREKLCDVESEDECGTVTEVKDFLLCFDFTRERFGPRLPLPFHTCVDECVTLSCVRDEQLAVLYYQEGLNDYSCGSVEVWVTTRIEPSSVSWTKFLNVEMRPFALTGVRFDEFQGGSFFLDEQERVAVVFDLDGYLPNKTPRYHTAFVAGEDGYFKSVSLGEASNSGKRCQITGYLPEVYAPALVCSSFYRPSLVQLN
ncbi:unnamed protein product [Microthlaspi erraticum]|uniref:F-box associated beta-propeller type 1 domain-containing protein n=1 Tax=Microthlaspi erraticum TaxID=1685480 RepID=A0A6D2J0G6_9BRAS|nr:unnamed protein product [Microthlaspi erraticum]